jgi:hypothetical protein
VKLTKKQKKQRAKRGFSYLDAWSGDTYLLFVMSGLLKHYVKAKSGVPGSYLKEGETFESVSIKVMEKRRNKDYLRIAGLMDRAQEGTVWLTQEGVDKWGGITEAEYEEILDWVRVHFNEFWT